MDRVTSEIGKLTERIAKDPKSKLFVPLAEEYKKIGDIEMAIHVLTEGLKNSPGYVTGRSFLGRLLIEKGDLTGAQKEFEEVVKAIPDNLLGQRKLGDIYALQGKPKDALACYRSAINLNPKDHEILALIADLEAGRDITAKIGKPKVQQNADLAPQHVQEKSSPEPSRQPVQAVLSGPGTGVKTATVPPTPPPPEVEVAEEVLDVQPLDEEPALKETEPAPERFDFLSEGKMNAGEGPIPGLEVSVPGGFFEDAPVVVPEPEVPGEGMVETGEKAVAEPGAEPDKETGETELPSFPEIEEASSEVIKKSDDFTTDTLAELYISQGFYEKAIDIYDRMLAENPGHQGLRDKLARLHAMAEEAGGGNQADGQRNEEEHAPGHGQGAIPEGDGISEPGVAGGAYFDSPVPEQAQEMLPADAAFDLGEPFGQMPFGGMDQEAKEYVPPAPSPEEGFESPPPFGGGFDLSEKQIQSPVEEEIEIETDIEQTPPAGVARPAAPFRPQTVDHAPFQTEPDRVTQPEEPVSKSAKETRKETISRLELWLKNIAKEK